MRLTRRAAILGMVLSPIAALLRGKQEPATGGPVTESFMGFSVEGEGPVTGYTYSKECTSDFKDTLCNYDGPTAETCAAKVDTFTPPHINQPTTGQETQ